MPSDTIANRPDPDYLSSKGISSEKPDSKLIYPPSGRALMMARMANGGGGPVVPCSADWSYWNAMDRVSLEEAILLSLGLDPRPGGQGSSDPRAVVALLDQLKIVGTERIPGRLRIVESHEQALGTVDRKVRLASFVAWAMSMGWEIPDALEPIRPEKTRLQRLEAIAEQFCKAQSLRGHGWPTDPDLVQWLTQKHGTSAREGNAIAKIIRPDDLPRGPRSGPEAEE